MSQEALRLSRNSLGEFRVTIGGCGFDPVRWPFRKSFWDQELLRTIPTQICDAWNYIKRPHFLSSKSSNKPFNLSSKETHYFHNLPRKCVLSPQLSPSSRAPCSHQSKRCLKRAGNARPIKDCSSSNNRLEPTHSTANSWRTEWLIIAITKWYATIYRTRTIELSNDGLD